MLNKEDYADKTILTSLIFEDTSREMRRRSKSSHLFQGSLFSAPSWTVWHQQENRKREKLWDLCPSSNADTWQDSASQSSAYQSQTEQSFLSGGGIVFLWNTNIFKSTWISVRGKLLWIDCFTCWNRRQLNFISWASKVKLPSVQEITITKMSKKLHSLIWLQMTGWD